jgi:glycosyltransferase involved in cell wall biosynthesis
MPRKGTNPAKYINSVNKPERITAAVLNYIPHRSGFYADMLEVLKVCLTSLRENSDLPFDLLLFDNGSCQDARQFLLDCYEQGQIQYLVLSDKNLGKGGAWNFIFNAALGEIIAYSDNDVYFYPGWLSKSLQLLESFPKVGMVTSRPFPTRPELFSSTLDWASHCPDVVVEKGQLIAWEDMKAFDMSRGLSEDQARQEYATHENFRISYQGLSAFAGASHWQFLAYKAPLQHCLPFKMDKPLGQVISLDEQLNSAGYLRLMTNEPLTQNMSNRLDWIHVPPSTAAKTAQPVNFIKKVFHYPPIKRVLLAIYDRIFRTYFDN